MTTFALDLDAPALVAAHRAFHQRLERIGDGARSAARATWKEMTSWSKLRTKGRRTDSGCTALTLRWVLESEISPH